MCLNADKQPRMSRCTESQRVEASVDGRAMSADAICPGSCKVWQLSASPCVQALMRAKYFAIK
eukprot:2758744-Pleurochrysis_carterae.AAC.1